MFPLVFFLLLPLAPLATIPLEDRVVFSVDGTPFFAENLNGQLKDLRSLPALLGRKVLLIDVLEFQSPGQKILPLSREKPLAPHRETIDKLILLNKAITLMEIDSSTPPANIKGWQEWTPNQRTFYGLEEYLRQRFGADGDVERIRNFITSSGKNLEHRHYF